MRDVAFHFSRIDIISGFHFYFHFFSLLLIHLLYSRMSAFDFQAIVVALRAEPVVNLLNFISRHGSFHIIDIKGLKVHCRLERFSIHSSD